MIKKYSFFETSKLQQAVNEFSEEVIGNKIKEVYNNILILK